ncbi:unnamed protein product [Lactuca saligna]|uniref:Uncharacterized protein n=1 Tax=Lactuca saligna TaxID=75948 RepID=A0AA35ZJ76_LACSI|nr:unnamed protein product [Lactuca saligna]
MTVLGALPLQRSTILPDHLASPYRLHHLASNLTLSATSGLVISCSLLLKDCFEVYALVPRLLREEVISLLPVLATLTSVSPKLPLGYLARLSFIEAKKLSNPPLYPVAGLAIVYVVCFTSSSVVALFTNIPVLYHCEWRGIGGLYASLLLILYHFIDDYGRFGGTMKAIVLCNIDCFKPTSAMGVEASTTAVIIFCLQSELDLKRYLAKRWRAKSSYTGYLCGHGWEHRRFREASKSTSHEVWFWFLPL